MKMMSNVRGFRLGCTRIIKLFRRTTGGSKVAPSSTTGYLLGQPNPTLNTFDKIARCFGLRTKSGPGYVRLGQDAGGETAQVSKGHLAVYVGELDGDSRWRVVVPVMYFNHPLFVDLLAESERVYGFDHSGGITIPCKISEFEKIKLRIASLDRYKTRHSYGKWLNCGTF